MDATHRIGIDARGPVRRPDPGFVEVQRLAIDTGISRRKDKGFGLPLLVSEVLACCEIQGRIEDRTWSQIRRNARSGLAWGKEFERDIVAGIESGKTVRPPVFSIRCAEITADET